MDNINLYQGRKCHLRIYKALGPNVWNFTRHAAIIPDIKDVEDLINCKETATMPQTDISSIKVEDMFIGKVKCVLMTFNKMQTCSKVYSSYV